MLETNEAATLGGRRNFGNVNRNLSRLDTDRKAVDHTTDNEHPFANGRATEDRTNDPITEVRKISAIFKHMLFSSPFCMTKYNSGILLSL